METMETRGEIRSIGFFARPVSHEFQITRHYFKSELARKILDKAIIFSYLV
jgi:hypothetical protein